MMFINCVLNRLCVLLIVAIEICSVRLDDYFSYYEITDQKDLSHVIRRRSLDSSSDHRDLDLSFKNRDFKIYLQKYNSLFSPHFKAYVVDKNDVEREVVDLKFNLYHGHVRGQENETTSSVIIDDDGSVSNVFLRTLSETYAAEPLSGYKTDLEKEDRNRLIVYRASDVRPINISHGIPLRKYCGNNEKTTNRRKYKSQKAQKRAIKSCQTPQHKLCRLFLVADYKFYELIGNKDVNKTFKYMVSVIDQANEIFKKAKFATCSDGFGFQIEKIFVHEAASPEKWSYNYSENIKSYTLLGLFGQSKGLKNFCIGHLFTARAQGDDILGLSNVGGLCSYRKYSSQNWPKESFENVGFTTFRMRSAQRVVSLQAALVVAHEMGHSFGSHHDPESDECSPNSYPGNFLMYPYSVTGYEPNNMLFSSCSLREIDVFLEMKAKSCLVADDKGFCGNHKIEFKEECDEGLSGSSKCCDQCKLKNGFDCSDFNHECCKDCKYASNTTKCGVGEHTCREQAFCDGKSAACPKNRAANNNLTCNLSTNMVGFCRSGECLDVCAFNGMLSCICEGDDLCLVCCKNEDSVCHPYRDRYLLPDDTACLYGTCLQGICFRRNVGMLQRIWAIIKIEDINKFMKFMKDNIVGIVMILSLAVWIPASCIVSRIDRINMEKEAENLAWRSSSQKQLFLEKDRLSIKSRSR